MAYLIGIDVGTSGTKTALFDESARCIASKTVEYPLHQPHNGWAEQDPADWWNAAAESIRAVVKKSGVRAGEIVGVGLSGQMHGLVMLDSDGRPLRRAILWCDQRTGRECADLEAEMGRSRLIDISRSFFADSSYGSAVCRYWPSGTADSNSRGSLHHNTDTAPGWRHNRRTRPPSASFPV